MSTVEPVSPTSPRPVRRTVFTQGWRDVTFLHWAVDPALVAPLLPAGTRPDEHDGVSYVGLIPFRTLRIGRCASDVRLYSVDGHGRRGVVFRSLEADRLLPVLAACWVARLPYLWVRMRIERDGDRITYRTARRWPGPRAAGGTIAVRMGAPLPEPDPLAHFLTARWGLHQTRLGRLAHWGNEHPAWPLHHAELLFLDDDLVAAAGPPSVSGAPDSVLFSPGVDVRFGPRVP